MRGDLTGSLLAAWREAERAAQAAKSLAEKANEGAAAANAAAEAARRAAEEAGVFREAADSALGKAKDAYHQRQADVIEEVERSRREQQPVG